MASKCAASYAGPGCAPRSSCSRQKRRSLTRYWAWSWGRTTMSPSLSVRASRARVKAVLRRAAGEMPEIYRFGDLEVDFTRCELRRAGKAVDMTPIEFKLLAAFIRHRGHTLSRDKLLDEVWGRETFITDRVVDTHITNLRKKIEPKPSEPRFLVSVRGMGYRFDG